MRAPARLAAYGVVLAAVFAVSVGIGAAVGPVDDGSDGGGHGDEAAPHAAGGTGGATGLLVSDRGYTLDLLTPVVQAGRDEAVALRILDAAGTPVTAFDELHERDLHLIVVDRGLTTFRHVHPELDPATGVWSVDLRLDLPGTYRAYTDVAPSALGDALTLGADLFAADTAAGATPPPPLPAPSPVSSVDGGYEVELDGTLPAGDEGALTFTVRRDGEPVTDLDPYLGALGHLVAIRAGDLAYLHVHPVGGADGSSRGPDVGFRVEVPGPGTYRLFLDFSHGGTVRTADFTVVVPPAGAAMGEGRTGGAGSGGTGTERH